MKEWEILCRRSQEFLEESQRLSEEDKWELAGFMLQQHCELLLKCKLLKLEGSYPRTHSLRDLLRRLENYSDEVGKVTVSEENYLQLARLEDFYISTRYRPTAFEPRDVEPALKFVKEVFDEAILQL